MLRSKNDHKITIRVCSVSDVLHNTFIYLTDSNLNGIHTPKKTCMSYHSTEAWICQECVSVISTLIDDTYQHCKEPAIFHFAPVCPNSKACSWRSYEMATCVRSYIYNVLGIGCFTLTFPSL